MVNMGEKCFTRWYVDYKYIHRLLTYKERSNGRRPNVNVQNDSTCVFSPSLVTVLIIQN